MVGIPLGGGGLHPGVVLVPGTLHHAVLTVTSSTGSPIGVKYAFRTASGFRTGRTATARAWTAEATVRGTEPLSGLVAQVGSGSITCTASIDGKVVDRKSNAGRYATVSCFG